MSNKESINPNENFLSSLYRKHSHTLDKSRTELIDNLNVRSVSAEGQFYNDEFRTNDHDLFTDESIMKAVNLDY